MTKAEPGTDLAARTKASRAYADRARRSLPGGVTAGVKYFDPYPIAMKKAKGCRLWDLDGNEYIDYCLSFGPLVLGHGHPRVMKAIRDSLQSAGTTMFGTPHELEATYAERLLRIFRPDGRMRFTMSGTEATLHAVRIARAYRKRPMIAKFEGHFHGGVDEFLVSHTPSRDETRKGLVPISGSRGTPEHVLKNTLVLPFNDLDETAARIRSHADRLACVILEPIERSYIAPDPEFLKGLREITADHDIPLIFDEVMSGFRVAFGGAQHAYRVTPDLTCLGKIIGGGLPCGAFLGRPDILDLADPVRGDFFQSSTFAGYPIAMAAGMATLDELEKPGAFDGLLATPRPEAHDRSRLLRGRDLPLEILREVPRTADQLLVSSEGPFLQVKIVFEAHADVAAQDDGHRRHRQLHPGHPRDDVRRGRRELVAHVQQVLRGGGDAAVDSHDELEVCRLLHESRVDQPHALLDEAHVERFEFRFDLLIEHRLREELNGLRRVHVHDGWLAPGEVERPRRERAHLRIRSQGRRAILVRLARDSARRRHDDELRPLADLLNRLLEDVEPGRGTFVLVAAVDVDDRRAFLLAPLDRANRLESPEFPSLILDEPTDRRLGVGRRGWQGEGARGVRSESREESLLRRPGGEVLQLGHNLLCDPAASFERHGAARVEPASWRDVRGVRALAFQDDALPPPVRVRDRHDRDERLRVRVPRVLDELSGRAFLDDLPQVHDPDPVREHPREREVVGDEQVREALPRAQLEEELEDLRADRDVEHGHGFVGHQELRIQDERPGDRHALSLPSGELVRIPEQEIFRRPQARIGERLLDSGFRFGAVPAQAVHDERLRDDVVHRMLRIQRLVRILEDDLELLSQASDLDPLEAFLPQAVPNEAPANEHGHPNDEEIAAEHRKGLIPPDPGLIETSGIDVPGEHEAEVGAQVEREDRQRSEDQRGPRGRPGRRHAPEVRDEQRDDEAVADVAPAVHEREMEHGRRDEGREGRRDERPDAEEDPQEGEVRDGPRPLLFPGERVLPPDRL